MKLRRNSSEIKTRFKMVLNYPFSNSEAPSCFGFITPRR